MPNPESCRQSSQLVVHPQDPQGPDAHDFPLSLLHHLVKGIDVLSDLHKLLILQMFSASGESGQSGERGRGNVNCWASGKK